ncbi:MAG: Holliday junction branch migration protein RuvA [Bacteroidaceae bacterium]|nr:Holliday junction branch migration protein RuvA [Bacteroidaceae bacterium]
MIAYIEGKVDELTTETVILEAAGVGYELAISLQTYESLRAKERARLYVYEQVRQDQATQLYGFATRQERSLFLLLLAVSGVGGQTARSVVSAYSPDELTRIIANEDKRALTAIKGIGKKAAERIVVELRDKVEAPMGAGYATDASPVAAAASSTMAEAVSALTMLGFQHQQVNKSVMAILSEQPNLTVEEVIKHALKQMTAK